MSDLPDSCPWCGAEVSPVPTDVSVAVFVHGDPTDPRCLARNPCMCPLCLHVGGFEDFNHAAATELIASLGGELKDAGIADER